MKRDCSKLINTEFDLLVVGGGINGAAIANGAAACGARVALVEKGDWASGTSSKSTKLLHGGIRYLENFEFDLVAESLKERFIQWKNVGHLVKPLRFIVPVYCGLGRPLWMMKLGVWLYDILSGKYSLGGHEYLTTQQILELVPDIKKEGLIGGVSYFDAQMDDARIVLENVLMARMNGAQVVNYAKVQEFIKNNGRVVGVRVRDVLADKVYDVMAKKIIVAGGPWVDELRHKDDTKSKTRLRTTKGVHIVYRASTGQDALLLQSGKDNRVFFIIPFKGNILIGTTDTDYQGNLDNVVVEEQDIDYLLNQARRAFPLIEFERDRIITTFAGLRPLVFESGSPSKISRRHSIERGFSGVYYVMGGKYTTYRAIAQEVVKKILPEFSRRPKVREQYELYGTVVKQEDIKSTALKYEIDAHLVGHLMSLYGSRYVDVLKLVGQDASLKNKICSCSPTIKAQVMYAIKTEMAMCVEDIYDRRLGLGYNECLSKECRNVIIEMFKESQSKGNGHANGI